MDYQERLKNFHPKENTNCLNYQKAIAWAKQHGYIMSKDVSYNGFIYFEKTLHESNTDGYRISLQVYDDIKMSKQPNIDLYVKEADFGSIISETKYFYKMAHSGYLQPYNINNLDDCFEKLLALEAFINKEAKS